MLCRNWRYLVYERKLWKGRPRMWMHAKMRERRDVGRRREEKLSYCRGWGRRLCKCASDDSRILACLDVLGCPGHIWSLLCCKPPRFLRRFLGSRLRKLGRTLRFLTSCLITLCGFPGLRSILLLLPLLLPAQALLTVSQPLGVSLFSLGNFSFFSFLLVLVFVALFPS